MKKRKHSRMSGRRVWLLLVSLLLAIGLLLPGDPVDADDPIPTPAPGEPTEWSTVTVTTAKVAPQKIERPSRGNPKLDSSLNQLLEAHRHEGLTEAQAFATMHRMVLDGNRLQVELLTTYETTSSPGERSGTVDRDHVQVEDVDNDRVQAEAETKANQEAMGDLIAAIETAGGEYQGHYGAVVQALVPIDVLESLAQRPDVRAIREPQRLVPSEPVLAGTVDTEGLGPSNASAWHSVGHTGSGVRVAVIDGGFTNYNSLLGSDLPSSVNTYDWTGTGMGGSSHGTACAEVVYDMAPGVTMDLHKISTKAELSDAVNQAIADGVDIISMSLGWLLDGPGDGTGYLASIVNNARSNGIFYATAAGNNAEHSWSGTYNESGYGTHLWASGQDINYFGPGDGSAWVIPAGDPIVVDLHWDDWTAVNQDYDLELYRWTGSSWTFVYRSDNRQAESYPTPEESISISAPYTAPYGLVVRRYSATRDVCLRLIASHTGPDLDERIPERSLIFPADSPDAITVGAVDVSSYNLEFYSSRGPTFGSGGTCSGGSTKPDIAAYANVSTVSYGSGAFSGTSAATPHVAGAAALGKGASPYSNVSYLQNYLENNTVDLGDPDKDNLYGAGRLYLGAPPTPFDVSVWQMKEGSSPPTIDGQISSGEWDDAGDYDITILGAPSAVTLYAMNDGQYLYLAMDNPNDTTVYDYDQIGVYFDDNPLPSDGQWTNTSCDPPHPDGEGNFWVRMDTVRYREWIAGPDTCDVVTPAPGTSGAVGYDSGHAQAEIAIDLTSSALRAMVGDVINMYMWTLDYDMFSFDGRWPLGANYQDPATYGPLTLENREKPMGKIYLPIILKNSS